MPGPPSSKIAWMTYLIAGAAGWGLVAFVHPHASSADTHSKAATRTERVAPTSASGAQDLLARLEAERQAVSGATELGLNDHLREMIAKRLAEMPPTTDPAADIRAAIERLGDLQTMSESEDLPAEKLPERIEIAALFHRWLEQDPSAALDYANHMPTESMAYIASGAGYGVQFWGERVEMAKLQELILAKPDKLTSIVLSHELGKRTGQAGDFAAFAKLYEEMTSNRANFSQTVGMHWPADRAADLVDFALEHKDLSLLGNSLQRMNAEDAVAWLDKAIESDGKDTRIKKLLMNYGDEVLDAHREELGLEGTIALAERFNKLAFNSGAASSRGAAERDTTSSEVRKIMLDPAFRDVMQSFAEGKADAATVLAAVKAAGQELGDTYPDLMRDQVCAVLLPVNSEAAVKLLESLPEAERYQKVNQMANWVIGPTPDPQRVYDFFDAVPWTPDAGPATPREQQWARTNTKCYEAYGDDYLRWLQQLPAGSTRDMAVKSMLRELDEKAPEKAGALRESLSTSN